jgi:hypothetical protein
MISARFGKRVLELSREEIKKATPDWVAFFCCSAEFSGGWLHAGDLKTCRLRTLPSKG